jgi:hypothetical protein
MRGFINHALKRLRPSNVDLGFLRAREEVHLLQAEIHLLLRVPVGEDRLRALHHDLSASSSVIPELRFHPIFRWFEQWVQRRVPPWRGVRTDDARQSRSC